MSNRQLRSEVIPHFRGRKGSRRLRILLSFIKEILDVDTLGLFRIWNYRFQRTAMSEGTVNAVRKFKSLYDFSLRWSVGAPKQPIPYTKVGKNGFPLVIREFEPYLSSGTPNESRAALTILQLYKLMDCKAEYSLASITNPYSGEESPRWIGVFENVLAQMFPSGNLDRRKARLKPGFHVSGRNGPNGPALGSAYIDRLAIMGTPLEGYIRDLAIETRSIRLVKLLAETDVTYDVNHKSGNRRPEHSRIRIKYESGAKARPFAICDYFTQCSLKPIHDYVMDWLKSHPCDGTNNHAHAFNAVRMATLDRNKEFFSFDLTTATDRFPVYLQRMTVAAMFGPRIGELWSSIITDREFLGPRGERVRWAVGQPLGALSSWGVFAITHHAIIQVAYRNAYPNSWNRFHKKGSVFWFRNYRIIGDDVCIMGSRRVAEEYRKILENLGVEISNAKSFIPEASGTGFPVAELAKRVCKQGVEYTPVPPDAILMREETSQGLRLSIESALDRGYSRAGSPYPVQSLLPLRQEWASLMFPLRGIAPPFKGLRDLSSAWDRTKDPPAGLSPGWFFWADYPEEGLESAIKTYVFDRITKSVQEANRMISSISRAMSSGKPIAQGGDWQPEYHQCQSRILLEPLGDIVRALDDASVDVVDLVFGGDYSADQLDRFIGRVSKLLDPRQIILGRKARDEKYLTRRFWSETIKYLIGMGPEAIRKLGVAGPDDVLGIAEEDEWEIYDA
nr:MAG: RNA-dependent RNA polymerase [Hangzhou mito-like virus 1]